MLHVPACGMPASRVDSSQGWEVNEHYVWGSLLSLLWKLCYQSSIIFLLYVKLHLRTVCHSNFLDFLWFCICQPQFHPCEKQSQGWPRSTYTGITNRLMGFNYFFLFYFLLSHFFPKYYDILNMYYPFSFKEDFKLIKIANSKRQWLNMSLNFFEVRCI